jgi:WD40 repeat protein
MSLMALVLAWCVLLSAPPEHGRPAITALAVTPDETGFVSGSQAGVSWRSFQGTGERSLPTQLDHVHALAFSPDGTMLAIAGGSPAEAGSVELWSWPERELLGRLEGHEDVAYDVAWLGRQQLATASADRTVRLWDTAACRCTATLRGHSGPVLALAVSPDGQLLCSGSHDQTIRVWEVSTGRLLRSLDNHLGPVHSLAFRPAGDPGQPAYLASAGEDATLRLWQPGIGRLVRSVRHPGPVFGVAWSRDGSRLYTGAKDGCLRLIAGDGDTVLHQHKLPAGWVTSLAVRPANGAVVAGDSRGDILFWDAR